MFRYFSGSFVLRFKNSLAYAYTHVGYGILNLISEAADSFWKI